LAVTSLDLAEEVVDLVLGRAHLDRRVDQPGRADDLLGEDAAGLVELPAAGRRRDMDGERAHRVPFLEAQRPVVHAGGQAEAVFRQRRLAAEVAAYMPPICGTVTWLSSMKTSALSGRYSNSVGGGSPGRRPVR
jgi:hypothetical protein